MENVCALNCFSYELNSDFSHSRLVFVQQQFFPCFHLKLDKILALNSVGVLPLPSVGIRISLLIFADTNYPVTIHLNVNSADFCPGEKRLGFKRN